MKLEKDALVGLYRTAKTVLHQAKLTRCRKYHSDRREAVTTMTVLRAPLKALARAVSVPARTEWLEAGSWDVDQMIWDLGQEGPETVVVPAALVVDLVEHWVVTKAPSPYAEEWSEIRDGVGLPNAPAIAPLGYSIKGCLDRLQKQNADPGEPGVVFPVNYKEAETKILENACGQLRRVPASKAEEKATLSLLEKEDAEWRRLVTKAVLPDTNPHGEVPANFPPDVDVGDLSPGELARVLAEIGPEPDRGKVQLRSLNELAAIPCEASLDPTLAEACGVELQKEPLPVWLKKIAGYLEFKDGVWQTRHLAYCYFQLLGANGLTSFHKFIFRGPGAFTVMIPINSGLESFKSDDTFPVQLASTLESWVADWKNCRVTGWEVAWVDKVRCIAYDVEAESVHLPSKPLANKNHPHLKPLPAWVRPLGYAGLVTRRGGIVHVKAPSMPSFEVTVNGAGVGVTHLSFASDGAHLSFTCNEVAIAPLGSKNLTIEVTVPGIGWGAKFGRCECVQREGCVDNYQVQSVFKVGVISKKFGAGPWQFVWEKDGVEL